MSAPPSLRRPRAAILATGALTLLVALGGPALADPVSDCMSARTNDVISGCSRVIGTLKPAPGLLLTAYRNRGRLSAAWTHLPMAGAPFAGFT